MNVLCTICARNNSQGLRNKNIKRLLGKPLIYYSIKQALNSKIFNEIVVSTDSDKIERIAIQNGIKTIGKRPQHLSYGNVSKIDVIKHAVKKFEYINKEKFDIIFDLDITSPLRLKSDIVNSFKKFKKSNANNLITVCKSRKNPYFNMIEIKKNRVKISKNSSDKINSRQKAPRVYDMNASIYIWRRKCLFSKSPIFNKKTNYFEMPFERSIDIDSKTDFKMVEFFLKKNIAIYRDVM